MTSQELQKKLAGVSGYDLDGVLCPMLKRAKPFQEQSSMERKEYNRLKRAWCVNAPVLLKPEGDFFIVSGRGSRFRKQTDVWLRLNDIHPLDLFILAESRTTANMIKFKVNTIRELEIGKFYDDDPIIAKAIKKALPLVEVIEVPRSDANVWDEESVYKFLGLSRMGFFE